jgi:hypothetical protein
MLVTILLFFHFNQVAHFAHHSQNLGGCFVLNWVVELLDSERLNGRLLTSRSVDGAADLGDDNFSHDAELIR